MAAGSLESVKTVSDVAANAATIFALLVGAVWAYWAFVRERTRWPKAELELILSHRKLTDGKLLLSAKVKIHNAGRGLMTLSSVRVDVRQVLPLRGEIVNLVAAGSVTREDEVKAPWEPLADSQIKRWEKGDEPEIEPGENDALDFDLLVPESLETVYVYVFVANVRKKRGPFGWAITSYYDLTGVSGNESAMNLVTKEAL